MKLFFFFISFYLFQSEVINLKDNSKVSHWIESGNIQLYTNKWITITTTKVFNSPVIFLSTPLLLNGKSEFPHPLEARVRNLKLNNGYAVFQAKLLFPNDSYCSKQWWVPTNYVGTIAATWLAVENGGFLVDSTQIVVGTGDISGTVSKIDWSYTFGSTCHYPTQSGDDDYSPGGIFELQTTNNANMFLNVRTTTWWYKSDANKCSYSWSTGRFFLEPHDGIPESVKYNYYTENLGYLLYNPKQQVIDCLEGSKYQFGLINVISDTPVELYLYSTLDITENSIGIFSSAIGYHGGDSIALMSYYDTDENGNADLFLYLQEDQCYDEETTHFDESSSLLIITKQSSTCQTEDPIIISYTSPPTIFPTHSPTTIPTISLDSNQNNNDKSNSGLLLAIILPIIILAVIGIVAVLSRAYFVKSPEQVPLNDNDL